MSIDPTKYHRPLEPTQAVHYNPYEPTSPYGDIPIPPPPPVPRSNRRWVVFGVCIVVLLTVLGGGLGALLGAAHSVARTTSTPTVATTPPTVPVTPTAQSIIQDFQSQGLPTDHLSYGMALSQWTGYPQSPGYASVIDEQSSATFVDPSFCGGPCDAGSVWLGVYNSTGDAQIEYRNFLDWNSQQAQQGPAMNAGLINQVGLCLLVGES